MLTKTRFNQLYNVLNAPVKKVYEAVPSGSAMNTTQIIAEISRLGYSMRDPKAIIGCLDTLKRHGLIVEPTRASFVRIEVKDQTVKPIIEEPKEEIMATQKPLITKKITNLEKLASLSEKATTLSSQMKALASELETVAIEIEDEMKASAGSAQKLKQLQELLKGLA